MKFDVVFYLSVPPKHSNIISVVPFAVFVSDRTGFAVDLRKNFYNVEWRDSNGVNCFQSAVSDLFPIPIIDDKNESMIQGLLR